MPVMPVSGRQWGALGTDPKSVGTDPHGFLGTDPQKRGDPKYNGDRLYIWR